MSGRTVQEPMSTQVIFLADHIVPPSGRRWRNKCQPLTADIALPVVRDTSVGPFSFFAAPSALVGLGLSLCAYRASAERHYHSCLAPADEQGLKTAKSHGGAPHISIVKEEPGFCLRVIGA